jgi:putative heme iron utilization protein
MTGATNLVQHEIVGDVYEPPPPLAPFVPPRTRSAAEEARTLVASAQVGALATLSEDGTPWASMVTYGAMRDGAPVLYVSVLAEHGRNLARAPGASLLVVDGTAQGDPLDAGRVTLAGRARQPSDAEVETVRAAHLAALPGAKAYEAFGDFSFWVLGVERVRWVGGYGRMDSAGAADYAAAEPDPIAPAAPGAVAHLNADHGDALLAIARSLCGYSDATAARATRLDRYGLDLDVETPRGAAPARAGFEEAPLRDPAQLRGATVELARRART